MPPRSVSTPRVGRPQWRPVAIKRANMREEYDFSRAERGKFYRPDTKLNLPVYLEDEVASICSGDRGET